MGVNSVTEVLSGFLYTHEFTMRNADFSDKSAQQPFTFEIFRDVTSAQQYDGVNMSSAAFSIAPSQELRMSVDMVGIGGRNIAKTTPSFPSSSEFPFTFDTASVSLGGAGTTLVEEMTISIDNQLEGIPTLNQTFFVGKVRRSGPEMIRLSGTVAFENITEYEKMIAETEQAVVVSMTKADSFQIVFDMPKVVYTAFPLGIPGASRQTVAFEGRARYHTGSAGAIKVSLTTTRSFY